MEKKRPTDKTYMDLGIKTNRQDIYRFKNPEVNNRQSIYGFKNPEVHNRPNVH